MIDVFDIMGPIMVGPSSSHTAGAVRIGRMARTLLGEKPAKAELYLHGSFAETGVGHGTDQVLRETFAPRPAPEVPDLASIINVPMSIRPSFANG